MTAGAPSHRTWRRRLGRALSTLLLVSSSLVGAPVPSQPAPSSCLPNPGGQGSPDFRNRPLTKCNFSGQDLSNANFSGATLKAVVFVRATLTGADFSGATIADSGSAVQPTDFSFANLTRAKFIDTHFDGRTYLTYAQLNCADFSQSDISRGTAIFGDGTLIMDALEGCRTRFRQTRMNCEFIPQWNSLDLTNALIGACAARLQTIAGRPGHDFSGGIYSGVLFDGLDLSRSNWAGAVLENASFQGSTLDNATGLSTAAGGAPARLSGAKFPNASVRNVDFSNAQLYGANFTRANLENSRLQNALLIANPGGTPRIDTPAKFDSAHLKNVDMSGAKLDSVSFIAANFYGSFNVLNHGPPAGFPCRTDTRSCGETGVTGFTCSCATARGADLTKAVFSGAYLYGADFGGSTTTINGTDFGGAILVGANFNGATFSVDTQGGASPKFNNAYLQGADFTGAQLSHTVLTNAFVDFRSGGNVMQVLLGEGHTVFRGWQAQAKPVCVQTDYSKLVTRLPTSTPTMTCPNGSTYPNGCGPTLNPPSSSPWQSPLNIASAETPGFYVNKPTFGNADQSDPRCSRQKRDNTW